MGLFDKMGNMMDLMSKLKETQKKVEEVKSKMSNEFEEFYSEDNQVRFSMSKLGEIKNLKLEFKSNQEEFTQILQQTINNANKITRDQYEQELANVAKDGMPF